MSNPVALYFLICAYFLAVAAIRMAVKSGQISRLTVWEEWFTVLLLVTFTPIVGLFILTRKLIRNLKKESTHV